MNDVNDTNDGNTGPPMSRFLVAHIVAIAVVMSVPAGSREQASQLFDRYATTGETGPTTFRNVDQFLDLLNSQGKKWSSSAGAAEQDRRHHLLALLALETAAQAEAADGLKAIEWACELLRDDPRDEFERQWLIVSSSMFFRAYLETQYTIGETRGSISRGARTPHLDHALGRYPHEPRLRLAKILTRPESYALTSTPGLDPGKLVSIQGVAIIPATVPRPLERLKVTVTEFEALSVDREVGPEARAHVGFIRFQLGELAQAIEHFRLAADAAVDPFVSNLAWLGLGLSLDASGRRNEATNAYERAASAMPRARASAVQHAVHLFLAGEKDRASQVVERAFGPNPLDLEPWRHIVAPDRHVSADIRRLRALLGLPQDSQVESPARDSSTRTDAVASTLAPEPQRSFDPRFHSMATGVVVDALISARNIPVAGLTEADLEVTDRGQRQTIEIAEVEHSPLDISLVVDMFNELVIGVFRPGNQIVTPAVTDQLRQDIGSIAARLRSGDRLRVVQVDGQVGAELWPMQFPPFPLERLPRGAGIKGATMETATAQATYGRLQALFDPVAAALMKSVPVDRRHLTVVVTDGVDGASVLPPTLFAELARESSSVMYVLRRDTQEELAAQFGTRLQPYQFLFWRPNPRVIEEAAVATGGTVIFHPGGALLPDFSRALDQFRRGYVIRYRPTDTTSGWHDIRIRVLRPGNYEIKSRKGYTAR